jgi:hypothetical protein
MSTLMNQGLLALCGADTAPAAPAAADPMAPVASAAAPGLLPKVDPHSVLGTIAAIYQVGSVVSAPLLAYHGYKRHDGSFLWGLGWWLLPAPWPVMLAFAVGQSRPEGLWLGGKFGLPGTPSESELSSTEHAAAGRRR